MSRGARFVPRHRGKSCRGDAEPPLRSELFSIRQLEVHAKSLAGLHQVAPPSSRTARARDQLLPRLSENAEVLSAAYELISTAVREGRPAHAKLTIRSTDGCEHSVEASAFPILTARGSQGAIAVFWPEDGPPSANGNGARPE